MGRVKEQPAVFCAPPVTHRLARVRAFMDIQPVTEGHILLIPKMHASSIADLDAATTAHLTGVARRLTEALYGALGCAGVNWFVSDGEAAGGYSPIG